jgi:hypothetical protein
VLGHFQQWGVSRHGCCSFCAVVARRTADRHALRISLLLLQQCEIHLVISGGGAAVAGRTAAVEGSTAVADQQQGVVGSAVSHQYEGIVWWQLDAAAARVLPQLTGSSTWNSAVSSYAAS